MKTKKQTGMMPMPSKMTQGMGSMAGAPMMKPPMMGALDRKLRMAAAPPINRPPVMKSKGMPLAGFAPTAKKARKGKKGQKRLPMI